MNEIAVKEQEIEKSIGSVQTVATSLVVSSHETYSEAGELLVTIKKVKKTIEEYFKPLKDSAHKSWKGICDREKQEIEKLSPALDHLNKQMTVWYIEQEKIRKAEEDRLRLEALKKEEDERLAAALQAEAEGQEEEAQAILETPIIVPPPMVEKAVPKQAGLAMTTTWKHRVTSLQMLCKAIAEGKAPITCIQANDVFLGQQARAGKGEIKYPGVEFFPGQSMRGVRQ
mgnify:CR=1 FL=1